MPLIAIKMKDESVDLIHEIYLDSHQKDFESTKVGNCNVKCLINGKDH